MSIKVTDVKRLFGVSRNKCAFEDCTVKIVEGAIVLGEICHIRAQSQGGPRFDSAMSLEQIHCFDNLILLCPAHHKIVDSDTATYTVESLTALKLKHESLSTNSIDAEERVFEELINSTYVSQINNSAIAPVAVGNNTNSPINIVVNQGATKEQILELAKLLAEENFPVFAQRAMQQVDRRLESFRATFSEEVVKNREHLNISKLAEPAIQKALLSAQESIAYSSEAWSTTCLTNLLVEALRKDGEDFDELIIKEATGIVGHLREDFVKLLTMKFSIEHLSPANPKATWADYRILFPQIYEGFKDFKSTTHIHTFLQSQKCVVVRSITRAGVPLSKFVELRKDFFPQGTKTPNYKQVITQELPYLIELNEIWDKRGLGALDLTPIGIAIAISYIHHKIPGTQHLRLKEFTQHL